METIAYIAAFGLAVLIAIKIAAWIARGAWWHRDAERRRADRDSYQERRETERRERAQAAVAQFVDRFFPFAKAAWDAGAGRGDGRQHLRRVLAETAGVPLGAADIGFNAVLPDAARRQHLICLGKSGYGKTTIALHMIRDDLLRGRAVCILGAEAELFRDWLLPMVPADDAKNVIYAKFSDPACSLTWNPNELEDGEDQSVAAGRLFVAVKQAGGEATIGARADAILSSAFAVLVGRRGTTLWSVIRLMEDEEYRAAVVADIDDPYLRDFWVKTFSGYPAGAALPIVNRLHRFLRLPQLRAALCHPISSFSIRKALANPRSRLFLDVSGLDPDATRLLGQMLLSKFQIELMRRERIPEQERTPVNVYVDEFHMFAGDAEGTWRELLARGRRYGLGLHLFTQHPNQLPRSLQHEIFGNVSSVIALNLSAGDAGTVRRELLAPGPADTTKPVPAEQLVSLPVGEGFARLGTGACALRVRFAPPIDKPDRAAGDRVREISWRTYAAPPAPQEEKTAPQPATIAQSTDALPGRGGPQHKMLQGLAKTWGEELGFRVNLEQDVLGGAGRVDVVLTRGDESVAIEVSVTSSGAEVAETVGKCVASGFKYVAVVGNDKAALGRAERSTLEVIPAKDRCKVRFVLPDGLRAFLVGLTDSDGPQETTAGYTIRVQTPAPGRLRHRRELARLVGTTLLRRRPSS